MGIKPIGDWQVNPGETAYLNSLFASATAAADAIIPGPNASSQRHQIDNLLRQELENFVSTNKNSAYAPGLHVFLGDRAKMRCSYTLAMDHYQAAFNLVSGSPDPTAFEIAHAASGSLAKLLAITGSIAEFDALEKQAEQMGPGGASGYDWGLAGELRTWVTRHPTEMYKCGLYCLDQLGRMTQFGQFTPKDVTDIPSSTNGFSVADLINIGTRAGLRIHAALLSSTNALPVPSILHLRSEHFLFLREQRGAFYSVTDPVVYGPQWVTADDLFEELSGCVIVSDAVAPTIGASLVPIDAVSAASYRGRCHDPLPPDHDDSPPCTTICCGGAGGGGAGGGGTGGGGTGGGGAGGGGSGAPQPGKAGSGLVRENGPVQTEPIRPASSCSSCSEGMASYFVSEPYLNLWLQDVPMRYTPAFGNPLELNLTYTFRRQGSTVSGAFWRGTQFGAFSQFQGLWTCSLLSFAELATGDATVDLMLPAGGWATFNFPSGSNLSTNNYLHNLVLEKQGPSGGITNLVLHYQDGSLCSYGSYDKSDPSFAGVFYITSSASPAGNATTFTYDANHLLTTATASDGTTFTLTYDAAHPTYVTNVTSSYGASVGLAYDQTKLTLTNITDAAGLKSDIVYLIYATYYTIPVALITPYGTTGFNVFNTGEFDRILQITNADGTMQMYAQLNSYALGDWFDYLSAQVPTNTPVGTLDIGTGERIERNTFYWDTHQFAPIQNNDLNSFDWTNELRRARIRHWLAGTVGQYTHFLALSVEQAPSPDGITEGPLTFYDYVGKPASYEAGIQVMPSVIARVMPDGTTWYRYFEFLTNGLPTKIAEVWMDSGTVETRTNYFVYASNNIDLILWTNTSGIRALNNQYNSFHEIVTNYDALGQVTTNGYDSSTHQITSSAVPSGLVTLYSYNGSHRLQSVVDVPVNRTNSYTWNSDGTMATHTDPRNMVESFFWDNLHRLTGTSDSRGTTTNLYYVLNGVQFANSSGGTAILDMTATKDRLGHWTSFVYDSLRRKVIETNANGTVTGYGYCDCGSISSVTNAWGTAVQQISTFTYDNQGKLLYVDYADNYSKTNWYDAIGRITVTGDGAANHWFFYNNLGLLTVRSNAYGAELTEIYDILDRPVYVTDADAVMITNTYDSLNRLLTRGYPDGGVERFGYSAKGMIAYTNQINHTNFYGYDELGRKLAETNANFEIVRYTNNAAGDLVALLDGKGQLTRWNYDAFGRVTNKIDQTGTTVLGYSYDAEDRLTNRWSAAMGNTAYAYDAADNLTSVYYPHTTASSYSYDALNRLTNMVDAVGTSKFTYTSGNQLLTETPPWTTDTLTNGYMNRLRTKLGLQTATATWTNGFTYDAAGRMSNVLSPAGTFIYSYAPVAGSRMVGRLSLPNTAYITNTFDPVARVTGTFLKNSGNTVLDSATYGYNTSGQRLTFTNAAGTYVAYNYDNIGQLIVGTSSVGTENRGYFYDAAWNLNRLTNNGTPTTFTVDSKNQLTSGPATAYAYDSNGNLVSTSSGMSYTYDEENRLTTIISTNTYRTILIYDGLNRLRSREEDGWNGSGWIPGTPTHYIYDGSVVINERVSGGGFYTRGPDLSGTMQGAGGIGGLLAVTWGFGGVGVAHYYYHADGNGNVTYLTDSSQALAASYRYEPFGNIISSSGTKAAVNVYRFSSKERHANSGTCIYLYRWYDPNLQRWLNRDSLSSLGTVALSPRAIQAPAELFIGLNLYEPFDNVPVNSYDPFGQTTTIPWPVILDWPVGTTIFVCGAFVAGVVAIASQPSNTDDRRKKCDFYKQWCDWANSRPPDDPGKGWKRNAPCDDCYNYCMAGGFWPFGNCPMGGRGGPRWPRGGKWPGGGGPVYPTPGQY